MKYRPMGATGEQVSEVSFGTGDNAGLLVRGEPADQQRAFERALQLGINYWDTSPDYGDHVGLAEINVGRLMREFRVRPLITSKVEIMPDQLGDVAGAVLRSLEGSLNRLGTDWVDVLQIHNPPALETDTTGPGWIHLGLRDYLGPGGALEGMERARREGKVRFLGCACEHADPSAVKQLIDTGALSMINVWYDISIVVFVSTLPVRSVLNNGIEGFSPEKESAFIGVPDAAPANIALCARKSVVASLDAFLARGQPIKVGALTGGSYLRRPSALDQRSRLPDRHRLRLRRHRAHDPGFQPG